MKKIKDTAIIVPAYNEGQVIFNNIEKIKKYFETVIVISDGSTDKTIVNANKANAIILSSPINMGNGFATQTGIEYALTLKNIDYFATIDADGQHNPYDLVKMRNELIRSNKDIIIGSRFIDKKNGTKNISAKKKLFLKIAINFSNVTTKTNFTDTHNGLRIFNKYVAKTLNLKETDYQHCSEIIDIIKRNKYKYAEYPISVIYTNYSLKKGQSMLNGINIISNVIQGKVFR